SPRCSGVTACDRNLRLRVTTAPSRAIDAATPKLAGTSPGDSVLQNESRHRRDHSRSSRTGSCWDPPGSLACDLHAEGTAPSIGRGLVAEPAANRVLRGSPVRESAV